MLENISMGIYAYIIFGLLLYNFLDLENIGLIVCRKK